MYFKYKIHICILNAYFKYLYLKYYPALGVLLILMHLCEIPGNVREFHKDLRVATV